MRGQDERTREREGAASLSEFRRECVLAADAERVLAWHGRPGALTRLSPPWERVVVLEASHGVEPGSRVVLRMGPRFLRTRWVAEHGERLPDGFVDRQVEGPFKSWTHWHRVHADGEGRSRMDDRIELELPFGALGRLVGERFVRARLERGFAYRHRVLANDLKRHESRGGRTMKVLVTGSTGLVGTALCAFLTTGGNQVLRLVRREPRAPDEVRWDREKQSIDASRLEGLDAVVHLAGENVGEGRWTAEKMRRIRESRAVGTRTLATTLARLEKQPRVLVSSSAIGFYGDRGDERLDERATSGANFLAEVCREWEAACDPARAAGIRVVNLRTGVVLAGSGGALVKMLLPFKLGVGGRIGSGRQYMSWIALDDLVGAYQHALSTDALAGPVNAVSPEAVTNAEFTKTLGRVLARPTLFPMPAFAARLALGKMADELLLASARVVPAQLERSGFRWDWPELESALRHVLGKQ